MGKLSGGLSPALKKETKNIALYTIIGVVIMWLAFGVLHILDKEKIPFDYTVILGGIGGALVAVLNFFFMGLTVQKVASTEDEKLAHSYMKASYSRRILMQVAWLVIAIAVPCFQFIAGIAPLLFPGMGIKITGIIKAKQNPVACDSVETTDTAGQEVECKQDEH